MVVHRFFHDALAVYGLVFLLTFVVPDSYVFGLSKFMYPYFVAAYLFAAKETAAQAILRRGNRWTWLAGVTVVYLVLFHFYGYDSYIYTTGYKCVSLRHAEIRWGQLATDLFRMCIGFAGSGMLLLLLKQLLGAFPPKHPQGIWPAVAALGRASLGIYIVSGYINPQLLRLPVEGFHLGSTLLVAVVVLLGTYVITRGISRIRILDNLLLGWR